MWKRIICINLNFDAMESRSEMQTRPLSQLTLPCALPSFIPCSQAFPPSCPVKLAASSQSNSSSITFMLSTFIMFVVFLCALLQQFRMRTSRSPSLAVRQSRTAAMAGSQRRRFSCTLIFAEPCLSYINCVFPKIYSSCGYNSEA